MIVDLSVKATTEADPLEGKNPKAKVENMGGLYRILQSNV